MGYPSPGLRGGPFISRASGRPFIPRDPRWVLHSKGSQVDPSFTHYSFVPLAERKVLGCRRNVCMPLFWDPQHSNGNANPKPKEKIKELKISSAE